MQKFILQLASEKRNLTSRVSGRKPIRKHMSLWVCIFSAVSLSGVQVCRERLTVLRLPAWALGTVPVSLGSHEQTSVYPTGEQNQDFTQDQHSEQVSLLGLFKGTWVTETLSPHTPHLIMTMTSRILHLSYSQHLPRSLRLKWGKR